MITFITAIYEEARPFIEILGLKKRSDEHQYQHFVSDGYEVVIVGEGHVSALRNCSRHFALHEPDNCSLVVNVGICGSSFGDIGDLYLINKITDDATGRTYYPDLVYKNDFKQHSITTVFAPKSSGEGLFDMEASMVYEGCVPYFTLERMIFFKVISDVFDGVDVSDKDLKPYELIIKHAQEIIDFCKNVSFIKRNLSMGDVYLDNEKILPELTEAMANQLRRTVYYRQLNGMDTLIDFDDGQWIETRSKAGRKKVFETKLKDLKKTSDLNYTRLRKFKGLNHPYTNVYVEKGIEPPFKCKNIIWIDSYKDIFNRAHQNFDIQKRSPALILSKQRGQFIYEGSKVCQNFGNDHFYYCSCLMNCIFDCDYCYLCGMYPTGNVVAFLNFDDILKEIDEILSKHPMYLCVSYDTDLLASELMFGYVKKFIEATKTRKDLTIEIRTKTGNPLMFSNLEPSDQVIFAWTLSPEKVAKIETKAAPLRKRLAAIKACSDRGFKIRICFDPMIYYKDWERDYFYLVEDVFGTIPADSVYDVSIGVFRISSDYLKLMRKRRPDTPVVAFPFEAENGVSHYGELSYEMIYKMKQKVREYLPDDRIFLWGEE